MRYVAYDDRARSEFMREAKWYERRAVGAGVRLLGLIERVVASIAEAPLSFPVDPNDSRARRAVFPRRTFPFSIIFTVLADGSIFVMALAHAKRRPGYWRRRLP